MKTVSIVDIAAAMHKHRSNVLRQAKKEGWKYQTGPNRTKLFVVSDLPVKVRRQLFDYLEKREAAYQASLDFMEQQSDEIISNKTNFYKIGVSIFGVNITISTVFLKKVLS